jgi:putative transposase
MKEADVEMLEGDRKVPGCAAADHFRQRTAVHCQAFIRISGMTHVRTAPYYPQAKAKPESWNKASKGECIRPFVRASG